MLPAWNKRRWLFQDKKQPLGLQFLWAWRSWESCPATKTGIFSSVGSWERKGFPVCNQPSGARENHDGGTTPGKRNTGAVTKHSWPSVWGLSMIADSDFRIAVNYCIRVLQRNRTNRIRLFVCLQELAYKIAELANLTLGRVGCLAEDPGKSCISSPKAACWQHFFLAWVKSVCVQVRP